MNRKEKQELIANIKKSMNFVKSDLIRAAQQLREVSESEANKLDRIIARLERWQNA